MAASSSSSSSKSSSSSSHIPETKYDVFISFRGKDIRNNFLSHLLKELRSNQIDVFEDERLQGGDEISSSLVQAIEESSISLVIFSQDYASSKWCMEELLKIIECMEHHRQIVIPVFYNVEPSDVRHQKRTFEEAFRKHGDKFKKSVVMELSWRSALKKAADLSGFHYPSELYKNEAKLIEEIVKVVSEKLCHISSSETGDLVGIDEQFERIEQLLAIESREVRILGIWGMGGIGKTTIAKFFFHKYSSQYQGCCFLENVREESQRHGLPYLFQKLVSEILQNKIVLLEGLSTTQYTNVKRRLSRLKVFVVLDDVNSSQQLEHLIGKQICLGPGSRVIITTRDKQILRREHGIYEVQKLTFENSLALFCLNAFDKNYPEIGYEKQSEMAVSYANGIPLALKVLGSFLHSRDIKVWEEALRKLKLYPDMDIFNVLKLSYDELDDKEKDILLDIAFFFKGENKDDVIKLLDSCGFYPAIGIDNLVRKSLISISRNNNIEMHDLIQQMGWEIVRQESIKDPGKRSRLMNPDDVYDVLKNNKGSDSIEIIVLDLSQINGDLNLQADTFKKMPKLRILKVVYGPVYDERRSNVYIPIEIESFSDELRYLEWKSYPLRSLPSSFCAEKLVELRMPESKLSKLWDGVQDIGNLEIIDLCGCNQLVELLDFTKASKLREIHLDWCVSLCHVQPSILCTPTLEVLQLYGCKKLKSLEGKIHFEYLHDLKVGGCSSLEEFSVTSEEIRHLDLRGTKIDVLHSSIGHLSKLETLFLGELRITSLPNELCFLTSLMELDLSGCIEMIELPCNIKALTRLGAFRLRDCRGLQYLPELPSSIIALDADNCTSLQKVFSLNWTRFSFQNCTRLDEHSLYGFMEKAHDTMMQRAIGGLLLNQIALFYGATDVCYPGSKVPEWFKYQTTEEASMSLELDQPDHLLGFFLCCVVPQIPFGEIECQCYLGDGEKGGFEIPLVEIYGLNSDHVYIWYQYGEKILDEIKIYRANDHCTTCSQKISLEFIIKLPTATGYEVKENVKLADPAVKGCGVHPIYVSHIHNFIRKKDLELEFDDEYKEYRQLVLNKLELHMNREHMIDPSEQDI